MNDVVQRRGAASPPKIRRVEEKPPEVPLPGGKVDIMAFLQSFADSNKKTMDTYMEIQMTRDKERDVTLTSLEASARTTLGFAH